MQVKLLKTHTHAGQDHGPGDVLELRSDEADWLIGMGSAAALTPAPLPGGEGKAESPPHNEEPTETAASREAAKPRRTRRANKSRKAVSAG